MNALLVRWWGSVRVRVTLLAAGVFALTLVVAAALLLSSLEDNLVGDLRGADEQTLSTQATMLRRGQLPDGVELSTGTAAFVYSAGGQQISVVLPPGLSADDLSSAIAPTAALTATGVAGYDPAQAQQFAITGLIQEMGPTQDFITTSAVYGDVALAVASPLDGVRDTIATATRLLWVIGPVLVALVAGLAWILAGRALRPVRMLTQQVGAIESHSLHDRVAEPMAHDEIALLARTMNEMLGRLESADEASRRFVADASHELRTPIAVMRAEIDVSRADIGNDWNETSNALLGELDRLGGLVDDLLLLARHDEGARSLRPQLTDSVDLIDVAHEVAARRRRPGIEIEVDRGADTSPIVGDRTAIQRAIDHVVANASRSATSRVTVTVDGDTVSVDDDGSGIPIAQRSEVVRRFVRLDEARTRDVGGAGLGLAVASDVTAMHGGALTITDSPLGGARVTLSFAAPA